MNDDIFCLGILQKKMTIKLLKDPKEYIKNQVKTEGKDLLSAQWVHDGQETTALEIGYEI